MTMEALATQQDYRQMNPATTAREANPEQLAQLLQASRADTLATFAAFEAALAGQQLRVPMLEELNLPLWELGHIGWFADWWIARFSERGLGAGANPDAPRSPPRRADADALFNSSRVAHDSRWALPLPSADDTRAELAAQLHHTLALLADTADNDQALYFFRLALLHEDMHHEAAIYSAQTLGIPLAGSRWQAEPLPAPGPALALGAGEHRLGHPGPGFAFDNELCAHPVLLAPYHIDSQVLRWADYLPFVETGGVTWPRHLRHDGDVWWQQHGGRWQPLDLSLPACHLSRHEAEAWCRWAGRRLPSEAEWEHAATTAGSPFRWGDVWEWTASAFAPYPGFEAHPYRDYSAPWFDGRPVLRGASFATQPRLKHPRYRNYFPAHRNDIFAGFRSCAL
jgi:gamma-glutamyl hercynylcysteine S-oxide synthase